MTKKFTVFWSLRNPTVIIGIFLFATVGCVFLVSSFAASSVTMNQQAYSAQQFMDTHQTKTSFSSLAASGSAKLSASSSCKKAWNGEKKASEIHWNKSDILCWNAADLSGGWIPQGVGGKGNLLLVSWYTTKTPAGMWARTKSSDSGTTDASRLSIIDTATHRYRQIELVKPCAQNRATMCRLGSHAGGVTWAGSYIYVANTHGLYVFNTADVRIVGGRPVLPATQRWDAPTSAGISSVSLDPSSNQLVTVAYRTSSQAPTSVLRWQLDSSGRLTTASSTKSAGAFTISSRYVQGIASYQGSYLGNSSNGSISGQGSGLDVLLHWQGQKSVDHKYRMPSQNVESLYVDNSHKKVWTVTEAAPKNGKYPQVRFLFSYPMNDVF